MLKPNATSTKFFFNNIQSQSPINQSSTECLTPTSHNSINLLPSYNYRIKSKTSMIIIEQCFTTTSEIIQNCKYTKHHSTRIKLNKLTFQQTVIIKSH